MVAWRLDLDAYSGTWDSGIGAAKAGGRWNSPGIRAVYCALDPATAIIEVAVHTGFDSLDNVPHVLTSLTIMAPADVHVVSPGDVPNPNWLTPAAPRANQRRFGDALLARHGMVLIPSAVSSHSWNLVFLAGVPAGAYVLRRQERLALDPRLTPER